VFQEYRSLLPLLITATQLIVLFCWPESGKVVLYQMGVLELCSKPDLCFLFRSENSFFHCFHVSNRVECEVAVLTLNTCRRKDWPWLKTKERNPFPSLPS